MTGRGVQGLRSRKAMRNDPVSTLPMAQESSRSSEWAKLGEKGKNIPSTLKASPIPQLREDTQRKGEQARKAL